MRLAAACVDRGGPVRAPDVAMTAEMARLRETGLVLERDGAASVSLQILTEWFAAQALENGLVDPRRLASDFTRLERWRYPLVIAVGTFGYARVEQIFGPITRSAPAFASQVVEEGLARWAFSDDAGGFLTGRGRAADASRDVTLGRRHRPFGPAYRARARDGSLSTLGLSVAGGRVYDRPGTGVTPTLATWLTRRVPPRMQPNGSGPHRTSAPTANQPGPGGTRWRIYAATFPGFSRRGDFR